MLHQAASAGSDWNAAWSGGDPWQVNAEAMDAVFTSADAVEGATAFAAEARPGLDRALSEPRPTPRRPRRAGPLVGVRVVEMACIGPGPFAGMLLADMGADDRPGRPPGAGRRPSRATPTAISSLDRGRRSIAVDLKHPDGPGRRAWTSRRGPTS